MEMFIVVWILCAITSAVIAHNKGRNGGLWFFIGLVMGIFAVIIVACISREDNANKRPPNEGGYG